MESDIRWLQDLSLVCLIVCEDRLAISKANGIGLIKSSNKFTGFSRRDCTLSDLLKMILNLAIALEKNYSKTFVATVIVDIVKDMISYEFVTGLSAQCRYRYIPVAKMMSRHESVLPPVKSLNADDVRSKILVVSYLDEAGLYTSATEELPYLIREASNFVKRPNKSAPFQVPTY